MLKVGYFVTSSIDQDTSDPAAGDLERFADDLQTHAGIIRLPMACMY